MNNTKSLVKVALAVIAVAFMLKALPQIITCVSNIHNNGFRFGLGFIAGLLHLVAIAVILCFLLFKRDWIAEKLMPTEDLSIQIDRKWIPAAYRLVAFGTGIWLLSNMFSKLVNFIYVLIVSFSDGDIRQMAPFYFYFDILIITPLAIYLICGAPHFVRWQVRKTEELCKQLENEN